MPYAYYPYANELEVAFDLSAAVKLLPATAPPPAGDLNLRVSVFHAIVAPQLLKEMPFYYEPAVAGPVDPQTAVASGALPSTPRAAVTARSHCPICRWAIIAWNTSSAARG